MKDTAKIYKNSIHVFSVTSLRCPGESLMKVCGGHTVSAQTCATDEGGSAAMCLTSGVCAMGRVFHRWWIPLSIDQQFGNYCNIIHDVIINAIIHTFQADIPYPVLPLSSDCIISLLLEDTIIETFFLSVWRVLQPNGSMQIHYAAKSNYIIITSHVLFQLQIALREMWESTDICLTHTSTKIVHILYSPVVVLASPFYKSFAHLGSVWLVAKLYYMQYIYPHKEKKTYVVKLSQQRSCYVHWAGNRNSKSKSIRHRSSKSWNSSEVGWNKRYHVAWT